MYIHISMYNKINLSENISLYITKLVKNKNTFYFL